MTPSRTRPDAADSARQRRLERERLGERFEREEREQPRGERHERGEPLRARPPQRREPGQPERDRYDADEEADHGVTEESLRRGLRRLDRGRDLLRALDPARARHADRQRLAVDPVIGDDDRRRAKPAQRPVAVERVRHDRVVDRDRSDRDVVALRVRHLDLDLARPELDPADVELVRRRRVLPDELEERVAGGDEDRDRADERHDREQRPEPPVRAAQPRCERAGFHVSRSPRRSPSSRARRTRSGARGT